MKLFAKLFLSLILIATASNVFGQSRTKVPADLIGSWFEGSASILQEKNMSSGAVASKYGSSIGYVINSDGTFRYAGLIKSTMYGCTTTLWNDRRGVVSVEGDTITFTPNKDYWLSTNSCYPSANKEQNKALEAKTFNYEVGKKEGKTWLCMRELGKTRTEDILCFPRTAN
ncbi:MAG TPA: hypothetical protein VF596_20185 [Pyrinomonadaceae bacterium]|jgi:hypothetical protein